MAMEVNGLIPVARFHLLDPKDAKGDHVAAGVMGIGGALGDFVTHRGDG